MYYTNVGRNDVLTTRTETYSFNTYRWELVRDDDREVSSRIAHCRLPEDAAGLAHELKILSVMFSPLDLIKMMGPNTASYIQMGDQLGELAPGKLADVILLDGDPLEGYWQWLTTQVVIKEGRVVVDKRQYPSGMRA